MTDDAPVQKIDTSVPHSARIWNYWMGGKDNFAVDREAGDAYVAAFPGIVDLAKQSRRFLIRAVRHLAAEEGISQFLDIGTGLPTMENTHEVAQRVTPDARIVYVDNDPLVLVHARALLTNTTPEGVTAYLESDFHDPEQILTDASNVLNFNRPIAVMFMGVLGHVADDDVMLSIVSRVMAGVPSGSYLVLWDSTNTTEGFDEAQQGYDDTGAVPYVLRSPELVRRCFEGLELLEPGLVPISLWRPDTDTDTDDAVAVDGYGAIGRKP